MVLIKNLSNTLLYFLIFTIVSSALAYKIVISAYDGILDTQQYEEYE
ncbi:MAG: hypothetical protein AAB815_03105 [Patescibacteria group bacterium]